MPTLPTNPHYIGDSGHVNDHNTIVTALSSAVYTTGQSGTVDLSGATLKGAGMDAISPSSIANAGGSASFTGNKVTFTGVTSVSLNGLFTSTYANYRVLIKWTGSASHNLSFRLRASGSDASTSIYQYGVFYLLWTGTTGSDASTSGSATSVFMTGAGSNLSSVGLDVFDPNKASQEKTLQWQAVDGQNGAFRFGGCRGLSTSAYDGFTIYPTTGNITGTVHVFGYRGS